MEKMNTKITFYWTILQDREFKKIVFQAVLPGKPFENMYAAQEWEEQQTPNIVSEYDFELVFDRVIVFYSPTDDDVQDIHIIDQIPGILEFKSKVKKIRKKKEDTSPETTIERLRRQIVEIESNDAFKYGLIENELFNLKVEKLKLEIEVIQLKRQKLNEAKKEPITPPKSRDYQSIWMDRLGTVHEVEFARHEEFAQQILDDRGDIKESGDFAYEILQDEGWIRVLGWTRPPTFVLPDYITPSQKTALKEYCEAQKLEYSEYPEILKYK